MSSDPPIPQELLDALPADTFGEQQIYKQGKFIIEMLPEGYIALNKELATGLHKALEEKLKRFPPDEVDMRLSEVCVHCGIVLDGAYTLAERDKLCAILAGRLEVLREIAPPQTILM